ncbi:hypothetical protein TL16_g07971 [Triparma laevis f. inornata]|uniref:U-box domain-containing protein n=2 Tax=Triparma laevis TaxID=1534972 RepID=A0A9W7A1I0_9STRA|nr:hypothetical protein TrLO_g237 [Triparma laevis f. longispina]GMH78903.1 hypothetical protein TL16_g07971 [Triparma laevis f. inornata]
MAFFLTNILSGCNPTQPLNLPSMTRPLPSNTNKKNSPVTPPLPSYLRNDDFEIFLDEIFASFHRSLAMSEVLRKYKRDFRENLGIRTLTQALQMSSDHYKQVIKNSTHIKSLEDGIVALKDLRPTFYNVVIPREIAGGNQLVKHWRLASVEIKLGQFFIMQISFKWSYINHDSSLSNSLFSKNYHERYAPTIGWTVGWGGGGGDSGTRNFDLDEDEYLIGFKGAKEIRRGCIMELEFFTNKGRKLNVETVKRSSSHCEKFNFKATWSPNTAFGIMGLKVGFKQSSKENYAGISNLVAVCHELNENPGRAYLPQENDLSEGIRPLYVEPVQQVHSSALQRPGGQQQRHRVVNAITGEYEEEDIFSRADTTTMTATAPNPSQQRTTPTIDTAPNAPNPHDFQDRSSFPPPPVEVPSLERFSSIPQESPLAVNFIDHSFREKFLTGPISCEEFDDPVILSDGHTYERKFIMKWLAKKNTSPMTREVLKNKDLTLNKLVQQLLNLDEGKKGGKEELVRSLLCCPLTRKVFITPVVLKADGITYEKTSLEDYLSTNTKTPLEKKTIRKGQNQIISNYVIASLIDYAKAEQDKQRVRKYSFDDEGNEKPSGKRARAHSYDWGGMWSALGNLKIAVQKGSF